MNGSPASSLLDAGGSTEAAAMTEGRYTLIGSTA